MYTEELFAEYSALKHMGNPVWQFVFNQFSPEYWWALFKGYIDLLAGRDIT